MSQSHECFLKEIANSLHLIHGKRIADLTIVFPNRRAGLFFTEYLNNIIKEPTFSPEIITIQELFAHISPLHQEDQLLLIFRLYKIYSRLSGSRDSFDEFYLWGDMLLHDFDQVDKYMVDAELLFTNITDLKEIDEHFTDWNEERKNEIKHFWKSLNSGDQKQDQKEFARLWQVLYPVYKQLREELSGNNIAYEGMLFRDAVEKPGVKCHSYLSDREFVVAGFNALNKCEKALFQMLMANGKISFYWDYDEYYYGDKVQEAGLFMRENIRLFPQQDIPYQTNWLKPGREFQIFHTPSQMGQAQIAAREVSRLEGEIKQFDDTAVILCDEELLLPFLSALPPEISKVNVTMGLQLKQTPLFSLMNLLISLQKNKKNETENQLFHYKNVIDILNNQLIQSVYPSECKLITDNIIRKNILYVSSGDVRTNELFNRIFIYHDSVSDLPDYFLSILHGLFLFWEKNKGEKYADNYQEYIYQVYLAVNKLKNIILLEGPGIMGSKNFLSRETLFKLLVQYFNTLSVSFEGEPLAGLQVMGILETRTLDFKNIVLLSVNEGIMPRENAVGSFIPYHLRRGVELPTQEEQNAMYAYYFYRLLQRAENVTIVYNSGSNGLKTGEKSRFIYQLQLESAFKVTETGIENTIDPVPNFPISIEKKGRVAEIMDGFLSSSRRISPTALDQYLHCPLSYYFKYIARYAEEEAVTEEVDARMFGKIFHSAMERLYTPFLNMTIDEKELIKLAENNNSIENALQSAFHEQFFKMEGDIGDFSLSGRNVLVYEVIRKMLVQTILVDGKKSPFVLKGLEQRVEATIEIYGGTKAVRIGGIIDRIDYLDGVTEIIDYKTGTTEHSFGSVQDLFDREAKKRNKAAFQTMVYGCIWDKNHPGSSPIYPSVYALKSIFKEDKSRLTIKDEGPVDVDYRQIKHLFEPRLRDLLEEIFNPEIAFTQTIVEENCNYCTFCSICGKQPTQS